MWLSFHPSMRWCLVALLSCAPGAWAAEDSLAAARAQFLRSYALAEISPAMMQGADGPRLRSYPLYPYLQAARIRRSLRDPAADRALTDKRAAAFLLLHGREPVARDLRRLWLADLASRQQWTVFLDHYKDDAADITLRCQSFSARIALARSEQLLADVSAQWLTARSLPACEQAFDWLRAQNGLPPELIERRVRLALEKGNANFARQLAAFLPAERAAPLLQWIALLENPVRAIDALIADPQKAVEPAALLAGWNKLVRANRDQAIARYAALLSARRFSADAGSPYALALALGLAWDRRPEALRYFQSVASSDFNDSAREWQTRAALWAGDWSLAARSIASMSADLQQNARWRYWAARAAAQSNDSPLARQLYESIIIDDNYYSAMAAAHLDRAVVPHTQKVAVDSMQLKDMAQQPALIRARELFLCNLRAAALLEWNAGYDALSEEARTQAIHLAARWGWHDLAIATATQHRIFNDYSLLYPQPFDREVRTASKLTDLAPDFIYSVMRQESLYRSDAVSSAGARGLLQLLPETARRTARTWKRPKPQLQDLFDPVVNIQLGAAHLRTLTDKFGGQRIIALAGYNAGPRAAQRWLPGKAIDADIWIENIPYNETRGYVQRILWHSVVFGWLRTGEPQRTHDWVARITPLDDDASLLGQR